MTFHLSPCHDDAASLEKGHHGNTGEPAGIFVRSNQFDALLRNIMCMNAPQKITRNGITGAIFQ